MRQAFPEILARGAARQLYRILRISAPLLDERYLGRGLDAWMVERASVYAETNGYHTAELPAEPRINAIRKALEDRFWVLDGERYLRVYRTPPSPEAEEYG